MAEIARRRCGYFERANLRQTQVAIIWFHDVPSGHEASLTRVRNTTVIEGHLRGHS